MEDNILNVTDLRTYFYAPDTLIRAVDGVSFCIKRGEVVGLVGESGSGKTMAALSILGLVRRPGKIVGGKAIFNGIDLLAMDEGYLRSIRGSEISIVFQEPSSALDPVFSIGYQIVEAVLAHRDIGSVKAKELALEFLRKVHIQEPERIYNSYPHQISGGTKQRVGIAMALINSPKLIILDEPTTALDVTVQAGILDLIAEIIESEKVSALFISHDLGVIARMCATIGVMHKGKIVEMGKKLDILHDPGHEYTRSLFESLKALSW